MDQLAWLWLRYQPDCELARWFQERTGRSGGRGRKVAIVALAMQATRRLVEVRHQWRRYRGRRLVGSPIKPSQPTPSIGARLVPPDQVSEPPPPMA